MNIRTLISAASLVLASGAACAQTGNTPGLGAQIAMQGAGNGVAACAGCHGAQGEGNAAGGFPRLAGQPRAYLSRQLAAYTDGSRNHPVMAPIAKAMTKQQIDAVAGYYAGLSAPVAKPAAPPAVQVFRRGETLATVGDDRLGVQGCANCHGPGGAGEPPTYPYLAGQSANYLSAALAQWKSGARNTDPSTQMSIIAKRLSDSDIAALAAYYAAQPAPAPETQRIATPARAGRQGAAGSSGTMTGTGTGTEQGAPSSGGSQGPGGGGGASGSGPSGSNTGEGK
jgi:cytochrome c553